MYEELQNMVLRHVQVSVRADGQIDPNNGSVSVWVAPNLEQKPRYNYLVGRLAP